MNLVADLKKFYRTNKRDLPWRRTHDPYKILVSEVMLQQTQVERVIPYYRRWIATFPTAKALAAARLSRVLKEWQGLGYNRRGKYLWEAAKIMSEAKKGSAELPPKLPGVGPYTRAAVEAFAFNKSGVFIETNIRTVFTHYYFSGRERVGDAELLPLIERDFKKSRMEPRDFYAALMDLGSHMKRNGIRINKQSRHYMKQGKFEGSLRQVRGAILREVLKEPQTLTQLSKRLPYPKEKAAHGVAQLLNDGLLKRKGMVYYVAD